MMECQKQAIREWAARMTELEKQVAALQTLVGPIVETPLGDAIWRMAEAYTEATDPTDEGWLDWYWLENNLGAKGLSCSSGEGEPMKPIHNIEDMIEVLG